MSFQSFHFLVFFLIILVLIRTWLWKKPEAKKNVLLFASYYFYMCWDWRFLGLIVGITLINYVIGPKIAGAVSAFVVTLAS